MPKTGNPAIESLLAAFTEALEWGQVMIRRRGGGFELRHAEDAEREGAELRAVRIEGLGELAAHAEDGAFRPLKSAPNLRRGWRCEADSPEALRLALNQLYPGSAADWRAARAPEPPVAHYREFTVRQSGMYRITTLLTDEQAGAMIRAGCHRRFCLKRRLWTVPGLEADAPGEKSVIPCLEPCAMVLEFARKAARMEQEEKREAALGRSEMETVRAALERALEHPPAGERAADFNSALNPRRVQLLLEKWRGKIEGSDSAKKEE